MRAVHGATPVRIPVAETAATVGSREAQNTWGVLVGSIPGVPLPDEVGPGLGAVFYYAGAGVAAVVWRDIWREYQKYRAAG